MRSGKLFRPPLAVTPKSARPRLSVRRWAFWNEAGDLLRDVDNLDDGVNVIWAADKAATAQTSAAAGHGAGKTSFCRLLRYGLGDALHDDLRNRLVRRLGDCRVGLVVEIDGERFAVVRSIQTEAHALVTDPARFLEAPQMQLGHKSAMTPLRGKIASFFDDASTSAWSGLLPVLARDQDARRDVATWREPSKGTREARAAELLRMLEMFSKAVGDADAAAAATKREADAEELAAAQEVEQTKFRALGIAARLRKQLGLSKKAEDDDPVVGAERLAQEAKAAVDRQAAPPQGVLDLRREWDDLQARRLTFEQAIAQATGHIDSLSEQIKLFDAKRLEAEGREAEHTRATIAAPAMCPYCAQPLATDAAREHLRAEQKRELEALRSNLADLARQRVAATSTSEIWERKRGAARRDLAELEAPRKLLADNLAKLEAEHQQELGIARHVEREARDLVAMIKRPPKAPHKKTRRVSKDARPETDVLRRRNLLQEKYDAILRELLGDEAHAELSFSGNVIESSLDMDGPVGGQALRVLSVLAFDVAAMVLRAEGLLPGPAFLVHDSPRDGDMSPIYYEKYLALFLKLEQLGGGCFQTFVTTTTPVPRTPPELRKRIRLTLRGPARERLLQCAF